MANSGKYKRLYLRVSESEYSGFQKQKDQNGLSSRDIFEILSRPCSKCNGIEIIAYKDGREIRIPRSIFRHKKY